MKIPFLIASSILFQSLAFAQTQSNLPIPEGQFVFGITCYDESAPTGSISRYLKIDADFSNTPQSIKNMSIIDGMKFDSNRIQVLSPVTDPNESYRKCRIEPFSVFSNDANPANRSAISDGADYGRLTEAEQNDLQVDTYRIDQITSAQIDQQITKLQALYEIELKQKLLDDQAKANSPAPAAPVVNKKTPPSQTRKRRPTKKTGLN